MQMCKTLDGDYLLMLYAVVSETVTFTAGLPRDDSGN